MDSEIAVYLGLSLNPESNVAEPHLVMGTAAGEVLLLDATRQGMLVLRVPVFR
jgi:hypothetical protein